VLLVDCIVEGFLVEIVVSDIVLSLLLATCEWSVEHEEWSRV
jgi:hypothetical protein